MKGYLTPQDLGELAGCTKKTILNYIKKGVLDRFPRVKPEGKHYRFADRPEIRKWCADVKKANEQLRSLPKRKPRTRTRPNLDSLIRRFQDIVDGVELVAEADKKLALAYFDALEEIASQQGDLPLLEGLRAYAHKMRLFSLTPRGEPLGGWTMLRRRIEALPIRPEAPPHSAAGSAKSRTKP